MNDTVIRATVAPTSLGPILVAATEKGLCAIEFGESPRELRSRLRQRFPNAEIEESETMTRWVAQVVAAVDSPDQQPSLPLDIQGTVFQRRVWDALRNVPAGTTTTYAELADRIGQPSAARAVAGACAANQLAVIIPCHRVIRSDGKLGGYRWGIGRKEALLEKECDTSSDHAAAKP